VQRTLDGKVFESKSAVGSWQSAAEVMKEIEKDDVFYLESGGGVTFSGGEPLMQPAALAEIIELCGEKGYHITVDTSGHSDDSSLQKIISLVDLWLFDLKLMDDTKHVEFTGVSNELPLKNLEALARARKNIIIRFPLVPGITDAKDNIEGIASVMQQLGLKRIDILPYHTFAKGKYKRMGKKFLLDEVEETGEDRMNEVKNFFEGLGFEVTIGG
jgi:pyruvate formate lyase activating enzyme